MPVLPPLIQSNPVPKVILVLKPSALDDEIRSAAWTVRFRSREDPKGQFRVLRGRGQVVHGQFVMMGKPLVFTIHAQPDKDGPTPIEVFNQDLTLYGEHGRVLCHMKASPSRDFAAFAWHPPRALTVIFHVELTASGSTSETEGAMD